MSSKAAKAALWDPLSKWGNKTWALWETKHNNTGLAFPVSSILSCRLKWRLVSFLLNWRMLFYRSGVRNGSILSLPRREYFISQSTERHFTSVLEGYFHWWRILGWSLFSFGVHKVQPPSPLFWRRHLLPFVFSINGVHFLGWVVSPVEPWYD